ncbi:serine hydrolase [Devosia sp. Naph2]|uniref:serine hydrolase n=1 Tax=Devosia polycyclovorans TaxID=3345148 RepID=UPI0035D0F3AD
MVFMDSFSASLSRQEGVVDSIFSTCLDMLEEPAFAHIQGIGIASGENIRLGGPAIDRLTNVFSITKAVVAMAARHALHQRLFASLDDTVTLDGHTCPPTIGNLLAMKQSWRLEPDMDEIERRAVDPVPSIANALGRSTSTGQYVNAGMHLLMRELHLRTGSARSFVEDEVLLPAGICAYKWEGDATGVPWGHAHLHLSVRDTLRLGMHWLGAEPLVPRSGEPTPPMPPECLPYVDGFWIGNSYLLAAGWGGQCLLMIPATHTVFTALADTGWSRRTNRDTLQDGWRTGRELFHRSLPEAVAWRS